MIYCLGIIKIWHEIYQFLCFYCNDAPLYAWEIYNFTLVFFILGFFVFYLIQVNSSGQFVGVAEMVGPVDFKKNLDFWQQNGRGGFFPVKWHIIKDIPNRHFKNITLENNDNKVVTFSRDTQEVPTFFSSDSLSTIFDLQLF